MAEVARKVEPPRILVLATRSRERLELIRTGKALRLSCMSRLLTATISIRLLPVTDTLGTLEYPFSPVLCPDSLPPQFLDNMNYASRSYSDFTILSETAVVRHKASEAEAVLVLVVFQKLIPTYLRAPALTTPARRPSLGVQSIIDNIPCTLHFSHGIDPPQSLPYAVGYCRSIGSLP